MKENRLYVNELVNPVFGGKNVIEQFRDLGYNVTHHSRSVVFGQHGHTCIGQIDLLICCGDVEILVEVYDALRNTSVLDHIERLKTYRNYVDAEGRGDNRRFIGAVAGAVIEGDATDVAIENGMYVIVQSGESVEIVTPPEGFVTKEW